MGLEYSKPLSTTLYIFSCQILISIQMNTLPFIFRPLKIMIQLKNFLPNLMSFAVLVASMSQLLKYFHAHYLSWSS